MPEGITILIKHAYSKQSNMHYKNKFYQIMVQASLFPCKPTAIIIGILIPSPFLSRCVRPWKNPEKTPIERFGHILQFSINLRQPVMLVSPPCQMKLWARRQRSEKLQSTYRVG